jgi:hypothetical protein
MNPEKPRPEALAGAHRAANSKELPCTFDSQNSEAAGKPQAGPSPVRIPHAKTSAAFHEAGHCVVGALQRKHPSKASIWPIFELGRVQWIGRTYGLPKWRVDDRTLAEADLQHAQSELAGVVSEWLFDPDFRVASSIDELVRAQGIVLTEATKLRRHVQQLWLETFVSVETILRANERVVRDIAAELMTQGNVTKRGLAYFLRSIGGSALGRGDEQ